MADDDSSDNPAEKFIFLEKFVRRLICQLLDMEERKRAANWLKFLKKNKTEPIAVHYLLILMLALTRKRLVRPFNVQPPEKIEPLGKLKLRGMCRFLLEQFKSMPQPSGNKNLVKVTYSDDYKQYSCVQELGDNGVQCYCAFSNVPVSTWDNSQNLKDFSLQQSANYLAHKMSLIDHKIQESMSNHSESTQNTPENFLHYVLDLKKFRTPYMGRFHVKGVDNQRT